MTVVAMARQPCLCMSAKRFAYILRRVGCPVGTAHGHDLRFTFGQVLFVLVVTLRQVGRSTSRRATISRTLHSMFGNVKAASLQYTTADITRAMVALDKGDLAYGLGAWLDANWTEVITHLSLRQPKLSPSSPIVVSDGGSDAHSSSGESGVGDGLGVAGVAAESCAMVEMPGVGVGETQSLDDGTPDDDAAASTSPPKRCRSEQIAEQLDLVTHASRDAFTTPPKDSVHLRVKLARFSGGRGGRSNPESHLLQKICATASHAELVGHIRKLWTKCRDVQSNRKTLMRKCRGPVQQKGVFKTPLKRGSGSAIVVDAWDDTRAIVSSPTTTVADTMSKLMVRPATKRLFGAQHDGHGGAKKLV